MLTFAWLAWLLGEIALFAVLLGSDPPSPEALFAGVLAHPRGGAFLAASAALSGAVAAVAFALGALSVPMLLHRQIDVARAIATSVVAVSRNGPAMALWAIIVGLLVSGAFALFTLGLLVAAPLVAHASWHAYRDLVQPVGLPVPDRP